MTLFIIYTRLDWKSKEKKIKRLIREKVKGIQLQWIEKNENKKGRIEKKTAVWGTEPEPAHMQVYVLINNYCARVVNKLCLQMADGNNGPANWIQTNNG